MRTKILDMIAQETGVVFPESTKVRRQPLWDTQTYTSGTDKQTAFFTAVRGSKTQGFVLAANNIPAPNWFYLQALRVFMAPAANPSEAPAAAAAPQFTSDVWKLLFNTACYLEFLINNDPVLQLGPIGHFAPGFGMSGFSAVHYTQASAANAQVAVDYAQQGTPNSKDVFHLSPAVLMKPATSFALTLNWSAAVTLSGNATLYAFLDGYLISPPANTVAGA